MKLSKGRQHQLEDQPLVKKCAMTDWLCTKKASYITGQNIIVNRGNSISGERVIK
jgi:hypothetical protein